MQSHLSPEAAAPRWQGEYRFALQQLVLKDFRSRYRNMSLGIFWSLLNPLIMMALLTFVFTQVFPTARAAFPVFVLCGIIPYNFFALAWSTGTASLLDNTGLIKKVPVPREIIPVASVLSNCLHVFIQFGLLVGFLLAYGFTINRYWLLLPIIWGFYVLFIIGMVLATSVLNIYVRDMRYVVESMNTVLFWLVPIFYGGEMIKPEYVEIYSLNPIAALVQATRNILMEGRAPAFSLILKLSLSSLTVLVVGWTMFQRLKHRVYDYL
ncbi:MAG: ABC transporter permease [Acidobacteria bacterium]|nr:ABC transporter permease [Acidobacteriota bacterium]